MVFKNRYLLIFLSSLMSSLGCDTLMTETPTEGDDFTAPFDGISGDLTTAFAVGDEAFERVFTVAEGLGPLFNNTGCEACHPADGRGSRDLGFFRISTDVDLALAQGGPQIQDKAIPGFSAEVVPGGVLKTFRLPPPVFGVGLIEAIDEETILAHADPDDADGDGISGRPNWVEGPDFIPATHVGGGGGIQLGRFSRKAQVASLLHQVSAAYQQDMGITNDFIPEENLHRQSLGSAALGDDVPDPEISAATVLTTTMYVRLLTPPARGKITAEVERGDALFKSLQCAACHVPSMVTGVNEIAQLSQVEAALYSDLLLHDMGPELADGRPDGDANGSEWRTAPLWGTRLVGEFLNGEEFYLHDGRAGTLNEAILLHGGEAEEAKTAYQALENADQEALIAFLKSL